MKTISISKLKPKSISLKKIKNIKHKKRIVILSVIIIIVIIAVISSLKPKVKVVSDVTSLEKGDMRKSINTLGKVESNDKVNVYSTLNNIIKEVKVKSGDRVNEGDVLCILDSSILEKEIAEAEADMQYSKSKTSIDIKSKSQAYQDAVNNVDSSLKDSEAAMNNAKIKLDDSERDYNNKKSLYEGGAVEKEKLNEASSALAIARSDYEKSIADLENAKNKAEQEVNTAKNSLDAAKVESSNNKAEVTLQNKKDNLDKCIVKAPVSGTITSVNASVGNAAGGTLFVIENFDDPIIKVDVKEVDLNRILPGQDAEVTTDATEDGDFAIGKVTSLCDTVKSLGGGMMSSSDGNGGNSGGGAQSASSTFEARIKLDNPKENDSVKVGMNAKVTIILDKKDNVFSVPFSSIIEDGDSKYIEILKEDEKGKYKVNKIEVDTGLETDVTVEIKSVDLNEGDKIIMDPTAYNDGEIVQLIENAGGAINE